MRYRLVIFDFDGTLADSFPWFVRTLDALAEAHGLRRIPPEEVEAMRGLEPRAFMERLGVRPAALALLAVDVRRRAAAAPAGEIPLFAGVPAMLARLERRGVTVALVTSNGLAAVRRAMGPEHLARLRHVSAGAALFGKARRFRRIVRAAGVEDREVLCVGDEVRDLEAAREAGLASGAVTWGYAAREALLARGPDEVFDTVAELSDRLARR